MNVRLDIGFFSSSLLSSHFKFERMFFFLITLFIAVKLETINYLGDVLSVLLLVGWLFHLTLARPKVNNEKYISFFSSSLSLSLFLCVDLIRHFGFQSDFEFSARISVFEPIHECREQWMNKSPNQNFKRKCMGVTLMSMCVIIISEAFNSFDIIFFQFWIRCRLRMLHQMNNVVSYKGKCFIMTNLCQWAPRKK